MRRKVRKNPHQSLTNGMLNKTHWNKNKVYSTLSTSQQNIYSAETHCVLPTSLQINQRDLIQFQERIYK